MGNDDLQSSLHAHNIELDGLSAEIAQLKREMEQVLDAESKMQRAEGAFADYVDREKALADKMSSSERVRAAVGLGKRMKKVLTGTHYRSAMSGFAGIKKALANRRKDIERRLEQCRRRESALEGSIRYLKLQISQLDGR